MSFFNTDSSDSNSSTTGNPWSYSQSNLPANYTGNDNILNQFQQLYQQYGQKYNNVSPFTLNGQFSSNQDQWNPQGVNTPSAWSESNWQPQSVDPAAAINAAKAPIQDQMNADFAAAAAKYGRAGALSSQGYGQFGLGKAAGTAANSMNSVTQSNLMNAAEFNNTLESNNYNARQNRAFSGWQDEGNWSENNQNSALDRSLSAWGQQGNWGQENANRAVGVGEFNANAMNSASQFNASNQYRNQMSPGDIMQLLGMNTNENNYSQNRLDTLRQQAFGNNQSLQGTQFNQNMETRQMNTSDRNNMYSQMMNFMNYLGQNGMGEGNSMYNNLLGQMRGMMGSG